MNKIKNSKNFLVAPLMLNDWKTSYPNDETVDRCIQYFSKEYVFGPLQNWYNGVCKYVKTNNGLEQQNTDIKVCLKFLLLKIYTQHL